MATEKGLMLRMLNLKDQKANKNYPSICPLKQNKESPAVFKLDSVVFILSVVCIFCNFFSGLSVQPCASATGLLENHRVCVQLHAPLLLLAVEQVCTGWVPAQTASPVGTGSAIPFPASHHVFCSSTHSKFSGTSKT